MTFAYIPVFINKIPSRLVGYIVTQKNIHMKRSGQFFSQRGMYVRRSIRLKKIAALLQIKNIHMKIVSLFSIILFLSVTANAQSAEDSVKTIVNKLFDAMRAADGTALKQCFADSAVLQTIVKNKEGKIIVHNEDINGFAGFIDKEQKGNADEQIVFETVKIDGPLAIVWTPYKFYYKGQFSHCGVNSFQLVRLNDGWKIQYLIDTRKKAGCDK